MAEAPSFSTSTRSMAEKGIWLTSTAEPWRPWAATRRPFSNTKVAPDPWPRRFAKEAPLLPSPLRIAHDIGVAGEIVVTGAVGGQVGEELLGIGDAVTLDFLRGDDLQRQGAIVRDRAECASR
jgi:hypothetical protein